MTMTSILNYSLPQFDSQKEVGNRDFSSLHIFKNFVQNPYKCNDKNLIHIQNVFLNPTVLSAD